MIDSHELGRRDSYLIEPLITEVTRFLGTGFYRNLSYQAIPAVPAVVFVLAN